MPSPTFFTIFFVITTVTIALVHFYLYKRLISYIKTKRWYDPKIQALVITLFIAGDFPVVVMFFLRYARMLHLPEFIFAAIFYPFGIWQTALLFIFLALMFGKLVQQTIKLTVVAAKQFPKIKHLLETMKHKGSFHRFDASRRQFIRTTVYGLSAYSFIGSIRSVLNRNDFDIVETTIKLHRLPEQLKGLTIGLISDIHAGVFMSKEDIDQYVQAINGLNTDVIFVPGDFITSISDEVYPVVESFANLKAKYGVYGCLGNHDFFSRSADTVTRELEQIGLKMLRNEHQLVEINGGKLYLIGIDDLNYGDNIVAAMQGIQDGIPKLLLCHKPYFFPQAAMRNIDVMFSGHTHGGQLVFAKVGGMLITPASLASQYIAGQYRIGNSTMYVSRGIGTVGLPVRINCPAEVTAITLV